MRDVKAYIDACLQGDNSDLQIPERPDSCLRHHPFEDYYRLILAGKRGEWRIMLIVPPGILCYMNMCSSEYMNILYTGLTGRLVMTAALMVYAAALWTGHKILDIHV